MAGFFLNNQSTVQGKPCLPLWSIQTIRTAGSPCRTPHSLVLLVSPDGLSRKLKYSPAASASGIFGRLKSQQLLTPGILGPLCCLSSFEISQDLDGFLAPPSRSASRSQLFGPYFPLLLANEGDDGLESLPGGEISRLLSKPTSHYGLCNRVPLFRSKTKPILDPGPLHCLPFTRKASMQIRMNFVFS